MSIFGKLFGYEIVRKEDTKSDITTFVQPSVVDDIGNAKLVGVNGYMGNFHSNNQATAIDITENSHIQQAREIAIYHEVDSAIEEIVTEAIITDENTDSIKLDLTNTEFSDPVKAKVRKAFKKVYNILDFKSKGYNIFRRWYIDGRLYYHVVIDDNNTSAGIQELRYIDPKKIRRVRQFVPTSGKNINSLTGKMEEYFLYNGNGIDEKSAIDSEGIRVTKDSIAYCNSGISDANGKYIVSFLNKSIAPANKLRTLENSMVIYRLVRAPERRIFYIDVGNLPKARAEQYLQGIMQKYKTKLTYDSVTGKVRDDRSVMAMTEDFYIPRRDGNKSTEITTLAGQGANGGVDELDYFKKELLKSLNVPLSRMDSNSMFGSGGNGEISKEESNFNKFIGRLRTQFNVIFDELLARELVLTQVMSIEEWEYEKKNIHYDYLKDNYFAEQQQADMLATRLGTLTQAEPYVGKYFSDEYVKRNILMQTDEEIELEHERITKEKAETPDLHVPVDQTHQANLHQKLTNIDMDKELAVNASADANPFAKNEEVIQDSTDKLNEAMTALFTSMASSNNIITAIDAID